MQTVKSKSLQSAESHIVYGHSVRDLHQVLIHTTEDFGFFHFLKRAFDLAVSAILLILSLPLLLIVAAAICAETPGGAIFVQSRVGRNGRIFRMYKFRTMKVDSENLSCVTTEQDPRVTSVGKFLRRSKVDELPQLINILMGDMSVIGPRPLSVVETRGLSDSFGSFVHGLVPSVRPGLIGLEQINRARGLSYTERFALNAEYERTISLLQDLRILLISVIQCKVVVGVLATALICEALAFVFYFNQVPPGQALASLQALIFNQFGAH